MVENNQILSKKYLILNEVLNATTHGIATILSVVGLIFLIYKALETNHSGELISYIVYGCSLILLYLSSTLYHSLKFTKLNNIMRRLDHASIFLLIAGTYTPYTTIVVSGKVGIISTIIIWTIAFIGVIYKTFWFKYFQGLSVWLYIGMGWISLFLMNYLYQGLGTRGVIWLVAGGVAFSLGTIFYRLKNIKFMHVVWHLFVILGTTCMFISIYLYV